MAKKYKRDKKQRSIVQATGIGVLLAVMISIAAGSIIAMAIVKGWGSEVIVEPSVFGTLAVSAFLGVMLALKQATEKYALVTGMTAGGYCFLLLAGGILFYESNFQNIHLHMLAIAAGGVLACVIALGKCGRRQRKRTASR